jgi:hypothetical protein
VFSFNAQNFMTEIQDTPPAEDSSDRILATSGGFILYGPGSKTDGSDNGYSAVWVDTPGAIVNHAWPEFDTLERVWTDVKSGDCYARPSLLQHSSPGASLFVPFTVEPNQATAIRLHLAWYVPRSDLFEPKYGFKNGNSFPYPRPAQTYAPWYASRFASITDVISYWENDYESLRRTTERFTRTLYDSTLPPEAMEAVAANLTILKSPTVLRQSDGRLWAWEGSNDSTGSCYGSCTHVWNYAQATAHLFPDLERRLRETEFGPNQDAQGVPGSSSSAPHSTHRKLFGRSSVSPSGRRPARWDHQSLQGLAHQRGHGLVAAPVACHSQQPRLLHQSLGSSAPRSS